MRRKLTVSSLRREWSAMNRLQTAYVPSIRLNGNWLAEAGYTPGQQISITIDRDTLTIKPEGLAQKTGICL